MEVWTQLAQSLAIAFAAGISPYATVFALGLAERFGWIPELPAGLEPVSHIVVLSLSGALTLVEALATVIPGVASAWEAVHSVIRPPAAALFAVLVVWGGDPAMLIAAGILGGGLGLATHATKLGLRLAIDTSPEPVSNTGATAAELGMAAAIAIWVWHNPFWALGIALATLVALVLLLRALFRAARRMWSARPEV
jgi:hypothetical protein